MSLGILDEHRELASSLREWARSLDPVAQVRTQEAEVDAPFAGLWTSVAAMGVATIGLPESRGGGGGSALDVAVALEACAHELVPGPLLTTAAAALLLADHDESARALADGAAFAISLDASLTAVGDLSAATHLLLPDADDRWYVVPVDAATLTPTCGIDFAHRWGGVEVDLSGPEVWPVPGLSTDLVRGTTLTLAAAEAAGIARWCVETAAAYAQVREQFGAKIGTFQAVKQLCAEMLEGAETVTAVAWDAAAAFGTDEQWSWAVDVAESSAFDNAVTVAHSCIQVLGGIGFTFEHDLHLYLRRALALRGWLADADAAAERLTVRAAAGVRRRVEHDLGGRDAQVRAQVRAELGSVATLPEQDRRPALVDGGYLMPHWRAPYGRDADPVAQIVIDQEMAAAGIVRPDIVVAGWALPTIVEHGTDEQRDRFVRPTLLGELVWCQLFSEPEAGSDLASLRTRAVPVDGGWRLTGQKVWTSVAQSADWAICLARTDPDVPKHQGISYFLVDMRSPGLEVRPLRELTGESLFNEVFLDDVFVPETCLVGRPGDGWRLARATLASERVAIASSRLSESVERAVELAATLDLSPTERVQVGRSIALAAVCSLLGARSTERMLAGQPAGPEASVAKLLGVRNRQESSELVIVLQRSALLTPTSTTAVDTWEMLNTRCLSIAGGTTQILRNVAAERILGLPR